MDPRDREITAADVVVLLNEAAELDPVAMRELVDARVFCNRALGEHPTIQTGKVTGRISGYEVGLMGILNGLFGTFPNGWGCIAAVLDREDPSAPIRFELRQDG